MLHIWLIKSFLKNSKINKFLLCLPSITVSRMSAMTTMARMSGMRAMTMMTRMCTM